MASNSNMARLAFILALVGNALIIGTSAQDSSPGGPTHPNIAPNCNGYHTVEDGQGCWDIQQLYDISFDEFLEWNPDVSDDCLVNFWLGNAYCVSVGPAVTVSAVTTTTTTTRPPVTTTAITISSSNAQTTTSGPQTSANTTYSTRVPVTEWDVTGITIGTAWPPQKTQAGQPAGCTNWHYVNNGHTCEYIVGSFGPPGLTMRDFLAWNPAVGSDCRGLYWDTWVCIDIGPQSSTFSPNFPTANGTVAPIPEPTEFVPTSLPPVEEEIPTPTANGLSPSCRAFYQVQADENCEAILAFGVSTREQFFEWNPHLDGNCYALWVDYYYCIAAYDPADVSNLPAPPTATTRPTDTAGGTTGLCTSWYRASSIDTCEDIVARFGRFTLADFLGWNLGVGSDCAGIRAGLWYCVSVPGTPTTPIEEDVSIPTGTPTQSGTVENCEEYWLVSDEDTCSGIARHNGISVEKLIEWNPALGSGSSCSNLKADLYVCVAVEGEDGGTTPSSTSGSPGTTTTTGTTSAPVTTTTGGGGESPVSTPSPVQAGMVEGCRRFYFAQPNDGCWAIANDAGIALDDFYDWNPAVGGDCGGLWLDTWYCIGISGPVTSISEGPPVPT